MSLDRGPEIINSWDPNWIPPTAEERQEAIDRAVVEGVFSLWDYEEKKLRAPVQLDGERDLIYLWRERGVLKARLRA